MKTYSAETKTEDGTPITVEYKYDRYQQVEIIGAERTADHVGVKLTDAEREMLEKWIAEHKSFEDFRR